MALSQFATGRASLDPALGTSVFSALSDSDPTMAAALDELAAAAASGKYSDVEALEAADAIKKWRGLMGATDPAKADPGTLRKAFGASIERNATHGSDAPETAAFELGYFFAGLKLVR